MEAKAIAKGLRVSPIRARLVVDMIRGKKVSDALNILINVNNKLWYLCLYIKKEQKKHLSFDLKI